MAAGFPRRGTLPDVVSRLDRLGHEETLRWLVSPAEVPAQRQAMNPGQAEPTVLQPARPGQANGDPAWLGSSRRPACREPRRRFKAAIPIGYERKIADTRALSRLGRFTVAAVGIPSLPRPITATFIANLLPLRCPASTRGTVWRVPLNSDSQLNPERRRPL
jgi:hypothetical protein